MCGRYLLRAGPDLVARAFGLEFSQTARDLADGRPPAAVDLPPWSAAVGSEGHAALSTVIPLMLALASAGVR
jgi:hypothetical protein